MHALTWKRPVPYNILLVDDDLEIRENYKELLIDHGFNVQDCSTAENALTEFRRVDYDLVVLDISMYGDNHAGHRLCKEMKGFNCHVPIAMLTSSNEEHDKRAADFSGADRYWVKSSDYMRFLHSVNEILRV